MDAPFGILFLKKAELYNRMIELDKRAEDIKVDVDNPDTNSELYSTWPVEKEILRWTYTGHKHLATPITHKCFNRDKTGKLKDWQLCENNDPKNEDYIIKEYYNKIIKKNKSYKIRQNIVSNGYAEYSNKKDADIVFNKKGLLLGEVIYRAGKSNYIENSYRFFSWIMDSGGAWILLILVILTIIMTWFINLWNIFSQ